MKPGLEILEELKGLSPVLAGMERINVFTVPEGYFSSLSADILASVSEEAGLGTVPADNQQDVPQGYFENLPGSIMARIRAQEAEEDSALLESLRSQQVFSVPAGYFDELAAGILAAVKEEEALSPQLAALQQHNVFTVPEGYFEELATTVLARVKEQQPAKLVPIYRRRISAFMKYAVAAMFTGVMALGVFKFTHNPTVTVPTADPVVTEGTAIARDHKFDEELSKVSDADIVKYLEANNTDVEAALVAGSVDDNELPAREDYITDEKTLDNYLNNIDLKDLKN